MHHGVPDPFGPLDESREREPLALTVGPHRTTHADAEGPPAVRGGGAAPSRRAVRVRRQVARRRDRAAARRSPPRTSSSPAGCPTRISRRSTRRASVYVQASRHEGFGLAVAEAMLAGCVPVVMDVTAMPEVVDGAGVLISSQEPEAVAAGMREALSPGPRGPPRGTPAGPGRVPDADAPRRDPGRDRGSPGYGPAHGMTRTEPERRRRSHRQRARERGSAAGCAAACAEQRQVREALLLDLGAIVFELHRQGRREPELLQAKASELSRWMPRCAGSSEALDADLGVVELVSAGIAGSCESCGWPAVGRYALLPRLRGGHQAGARAQARPCAAGAGRAPRGGAQPKSTSCGRRARSPRRRLGGRGARAPSRSPNRSRRNRSQNPNRSQSRSRSREPGPEPEPEPAEPRAAVAPGSSERARPTAPWMRPPEPVKVRREMGRLERRLRGRRKDRALDSRVCPRCGAPAERGQLVCLECGARIALVYRRPPSWKMPVAITAVVALLLGGWGVPRGMRPLTTRPSDEVAAAPLKPARRAESPRPAAAKTEKDAAETPADDHQAGRPVPGGQA